MKPGNEASQIEVTGFSLPRVPWAATPAHACLLALALSGCGGSDAPVPGGQEIRRGPAETSITSVFRVRGRIAGLDDNANRVSLINDSGGAVIHLDSALMPDLRDGMLIEAEGRGREGSPAPDEDNSDAIVVLDADTLRILAGPE